MKIELLTIAAISGLCAFSQAATILTDFSTTGGGAANVPIAGNASVSVIGDGGELTYQDGSLDATVAIRGRVSAGSALEGAIALAQNNKQDNFSGVLFLTYGVGAEDIQISSVTLKSGFYDGGNGAFHSNTGAATYTLTFKDSSNTVLAIWTGSQVYTSRATSTNLTTLAGDSFNVLAGSDLKLEIQVAKATTGATQQGGFFGVDSISMEANAIPEPATAGLGLLGLGALMLRRRRK